MSRLFLIFLVVISAVHFAPVQAASTGELYQKAKETGFVDFGPSPDSNNGPVKVIEYFSFQCPHCLAFDPMLSQWVKGKGSKIQFSRAHVAFGKNTTPLQRLFYALEAGNQEGAMHQAVFAEAQGRNPMSTDQEVEAFIGKQGSASEALRTRFYSAEAESLARTALAREKKFRVAGIPAILVGNRYLILPQFFEREPNRFMAWLGLNRHSDGQREYQEMLKMADKLIDQNFTQRTAATGTKAMN